MFQNLNPVRYDKLSNGVKIIFALFIFLFLPLITSAVSLGEKQDFFVNPDYDLSGRKEISTFLKRIDNTCYFYVETEWWNLLSSEQQEEKNTAIKFLGKEFNNKIYPVLTSNFGSEWKPGIDKDVRITILIHSMKQGVNGYFNSGDEYPKLQVPNSNEREMVYLNASQIDNSMAKSFLAHEFTHLITFYQKDKKAGKEEEVWLNEARAEYAPTLCGYNKEYEGSYLQNRVEKFLKNPSDSITEWRNLSTDYGALNLFVHYLVEKHGIVILSDSLHSKKLGINSINEALEKNSYAVDFSQIFTDWTITVLVNDCSFGDITERYCYQNENLNNLRITPTINFLPLKGKSNLGVNQTTKNWSGNWFKFIGGNKDALKIDFIGNPENLFRVPYVTKSFSGEHSFGFFQLDEYQRGEILVPDFGTKNISVTIIPSIQSKKSGFLNPDPCFPFFWEASTIEQKQELRSKFLEKPISEMTKDEILSKITEIEELLNQLKDQFNKLVSPEEPKQSVDVRHPRFSCEKLESNLYYGIENDNVKCLQEFLKAQGETIYPEGLVTGFFGSLTKKAIIRFQEKYSKEVLSPWGLQKGTGFAGKTTREKINELLIVDNY